MIDFALHTCARCGVFDHVTPVAVSALRAKQLFQRFVAEHQNRVGIDHEMRFLGGDAALFKLFGLQEVQVVLLAVALHQLLRMGWAE